MKKIKQILHTWKSLQGRKRHIIDALLAVLGLMLLISFAIIIFSLESITYPNPIFITLQGIGFMAAWIPYEFGSSVYYDLFIRDLGRMEWWSVPQAYKEWMAFSGIITTIIFWWMICFFMVKTVRYFLMQSKTI